MREVRALVLNAADEDFGARGLIDAAGRLDGDGERFGDGVRRKRG